MCRGMVEADRGKKNGSDGGTGSEEGHEEGGWGRCILVGCTHFQFHSACHFENCRQWLHSQTIKMETAITTTESMKNNNNNNSGQQ